MANNFRRLIEQYRRKRQRRALKLGVVEILESRCLPSTLPLYYSYDGTNNNLQHPTWGSAGSDLLRVSGTAYSDGVSSMANANGPNPRTISNVIGTQVTDPEPNDLNLSDMIYAWGQFVDHDLDLSPAGTTESKPITIPADDPVFDPGSQMPFFRAQYDPNTGTSATNPRDQITTITSFLDGSMIYGSDATRAAALRTFQGGHLKTSADNLLPFDTEGLPVENDTMQLPNSQLFLAGDVRANENSELSSLQVLFVREHNYQADRLAALHPDWTDEQLYQSARQIVIAEIQHITYDEFLPALLGSDALTPYTGYNPNVNPSIAAEFSEAAFRVGHSQVNENIDFFNNDGSESHDPLDFSVSADNPAVLQQPDTGVDVILKYLAADNAQQVDNQIEDALRNQLFAPGDSSQGGLDLYAIDIQRGRDVGLPDYNTVRVAYGLAPVTSFDQITSDPTVQAQLRQLYGTTNGQDNVNDIDLIVGGLAEDHVAGSSMGPTFERIIADQFERLRDGDRLWYQQVFSGSDLQSIQNTTLADIIERNTTVTNLQSDVFFFTTGTISGKVFVDANQNSTFDGGEAAMSGVPVQLLDSSGKVLMQTATASDGTYTFDTQSLDPADVGTNAVTFQVKVLTPTSSALLTTASAQTIDLVANSGAGQFDVNFGMVFVSPVCPVEPATNPFAGADGTVSTDPNQAFVQGLYHNLLGRVGSTAEVNGWTAQLEQANEPLSRQQVTQAFLSSTEYMGHLVQGYYQQFLHRTGESAGVAFWETAIRDGASEAGIVAGFVSSAEYQSLHPDNAGFITALYDDVLRRGPDAAAMTTWTSTLTTMTAQQGTASARAAVGLMFANSQEAWANAVDSYYRTLLNRTGSQQDTGYWLGVFQSGANYASVITGFLSGSEYYAEAAAG